MWTSQSDVVSYELQAAVFSRTLFGKSRRPCFLCRPSLRPLRLACLAARIRLPDNRRHSSEGLTGTAAQADAKATRNANYCSAIHLSSLFRTLGSPMFFFVCGLVNCQNFRFLGNEIIFGNWLFPFWKWQFLSFHTTRIASLNLDNLSFVPVQISYFATFVLAPT